MQRMIRSALLMAGVLIQATGALAQADYKYVHLAVPSPSEAVRWYAQYMECQAIADRDDVVDCGNVEILFETGTTLGASPGTGVDHIAFSYADVTARMGELEEVGVGGRGVRLQRFDGGATLTDVPGLFTHGFLFDPWGTRIELIGDPDHLGFHHVHLSSADPAAALDWYQDAFGGERARFRDALDGLRFDDVWLLVSAHPEGIPAPTEGRAIDHIGFLVSDLDEAAEGFRQRGIAFAGEPQAGRTSARRAFVAGPDSVTLAVVEPGWEAPEANARVIPEPGFLADAEPYTAPRTPWGAPDLQGIWTSNRAHGIPLERPNDLAPDEELTPEEAAARRERGTLGSIWGYEREWRDTTLGYVDSAPSTQIAMVVDPPDGRIPPMTEQAEARIAAGRDGQGRLPAGPEDLSTWVRCITRGLPGMMLPTIYNNGLQIVQSPGYVAIQKEMIHETRVIPTDPRPPLGGNLRQWLGDSQGHWEGDTLVIEVTGFNGRTPYRGSGETLKLVERFTRVGPDALRYEFTVDDPSTWTRPWTAGFVFERDDEQYELVEYACHEGNYGMTNILSGARAQEAGDANAEN